MYNGDGEIIFKREYSISGIRKIITEAVNWKLEKQVLHSRYGDVNCNKTALSQSVQEPLRYKDKSQQSLTYSSWYSTVLLKDQLR